MVADAVHCLTGHFVSQVEIDLQPFQGFQGRLSKIRLNDYESVMINVASMVISDLWKERPLKAHIHVIVKLPKIAHRALSPQTPENKRPRLEGSEAPSTPNMIQSQSPQTQGMSHTFSLWLLSSRF